MVVCRIFQIIVPRVCEHEFPIILALSRHTRGYDHPDCWTSTPCIAFAVVWLPHLACVIGVVATIAPGLAHDATVRRDSIARGGARGVDTWDTTFLVHDERFRVPVRGLSTAFTLLTGRAS